ncbi:MAG: NRDE family protein [Verrucomicrobiales bacterium]|nr:NRDE family protein [Verrucomicrobiales bacterium]
MCTATFWPTLDGYRVAMNRDEQRRRPVALPPVKHSSAAGTALHPTESGGGTWISLNDSGITFLLVNWYAILSKNDPDAPSRGVIIAGLRHSQSVETTRPDPQPGTRPFRLVGVFPETRSIREWRWDQRRLFTLDLPWEPQQWISSGRDEPGAQRYRSATFAHHRALPHAGSLSWLQALHASHDPEPGPYSHCVHRPDAVTVSYTEIEVAHGSATLRYQSSSPCQPGPWHEASVPRKSGVG